LKKTNSFLIIYLIVLTGIIGFLIHPLTLRNEEIKKDDFNSDYFNLKQSSEKNILKVAMVGDIDTIDPVDSWDYPSNDVMNQITEPLVWADLTSQESPDEVIKLVPCLAKNWSYNADGTELTMDLREDVWFHDGVKFDANAAVYSIDRLMYFTNSSGSLADGTSKAFPWSLYYFSNGSTPIIKSIEKTGTYQIKFTLNNPYGPFIALLSYTASHIVSPNTPNRRYLDLEEDILVGTGPFELVNYISGSECRFKRNEVWWGGNKEDGSSIGPVFWDEIVYLIYEDSTRASNDLLDKRIAYGGMINSLLPQAEDDPHIEVKNWGTGTCYFYWGINCKLFPQKLRAAMAYVLNYTYVTEEIREGTAIKANTCISASIPGYNASVQPPAYNVIRAREIMNSIYGTAYDTSDDQVWRDKSANNPFEIITLFRHEGSHFNELLNAMVADNFASIGIATEEDINDWTTFLQWSAPGGRDNLEFWYIGWCPDYLSAFNMMNPLFNPNSETASHQCWKGDVGSQYNLSIRDKLQKMEIETDPIIRQDLASQMQSSLFDGEDALLPHIPMFFSKLTYTHLKSLENVPYNSMQNWYWAPTNGSISYNLLELKINNPNSGKVCGTEAPYYDIEIGGEPADEIWYKINDGIDIYFGNSTGFINQQIWDNTNDGNVLITFYANNSKGYEISRNITIVKDTQNPYLNVISPNNNETYGENPPSYIIEVRDDHIDRIWYTFANESKKYFITYNSTIDQETWSSNPDGRIILEFCVNDTAGQESSQQIIVIKSLNQDSNGKNSDFLEIPGYNFRFLLSFFIVGIAIVIWQNSKQE
jgi:ABC-type transport system substrate-binding protein